MALQVEHELHKRRRSRNLGLLAVLLLFVALVFALSVVKITQGDLMEGFDHTLRASALPITEPLPAPNASTDPTAATPAQPAVTPVDTPSSAPQVSPQAQGTETQQ
ncbi:hypothetical protein QWZ10_09900 [Paracoccus cavernae]|uniref:Cytochrome C oxidase assembly protein n=1 Tax=Paracoccus cavernae TaxID=1571207 RepID=A0ABT8D5I0_9RHOB|nr:hypothetical protein [Paracoccus cavernae]